MTTQESVPQAVPPNFKATHEIVMLTQPPEVRAALTKEMHDMIVEVENIERLGSKGLNFPMLGLTLGSLLGVFVAVISGENVGSGGASGLTVGTTLGLLAEQKANNKQYAITQRIISDREGNFARRVWEALPQENKDILKAKKSTRNTR